jgi:hypothetical protein
VKKLGPDVGLVPEFDDLNRAFYFADPVDYFTYRHHALLLHWAKTDEVDALMSGEVTWRDFKFRFTESSLDADEQKRRFEAALHIESVVLLHHVGETLLRLFLAHRGSPPCPYLELVRLRGAGDFAAAARSLARGDIRADVAEVFFVAEDPASVNETIPAGEWSAGIDNVTEWIRYFAREIDEGANLYNGAKHGLGVGVGDAGITYGALIDDDGPGITYLARETQGDRYIWSHNLRLLNVERDFIATDTARRLLRQLWAVARLRYQEIVPADGLNAFTSPTFNEALHETTKTGVSATGLKVPLLYYARRDAN